MGEVQPVRSRMMRSESPILDWVLPSSGRRIDHRPKQQTNMADDRVLDSESVASESAVAGQYSEELGKFC
jgi:hypothetical protein